MSEGRVGIKTAIFGAGAAAVVAIAIYVMNPGPEAPPAADGSPNAGDEGTGATSPEVLAPEGYVVRELDASRSPILHLGLVSEDGGGYLCTFGEPRSDTAPLTPLRCTTADAADLAPPPRGLFGTPLILADRTYETDDEGQLVAQRGDESVVVSPLPPAPERVEVCETTGVDVVAVDGDLVHGVRETVVAFVGADSLLGAASVETHVFEYHLACRPEEARLTWMSADVDGQAPILVVHQAICDLSECQLVTSRLARTGTDPRVASIAGQVLLLYAGNDGTHLRLAPITEIATARDLDVPRDPDAPILSRSLFARGGAAIVTLRSTFGVSALRVDATGTVAPIAPARADSSRGRAPPPARASTPRRGGGRGPTR